MASKIKVDQLETADGSGTIALQNQLSGMTTASLPALGSAQMPTGSVLQVKQDFNTGTATATSSSFANMMSITITPSSTSSKILIMFVASITTTERTCQLRLTRDGTAIGVGDAAGNRVQSTVGMYHPTSDGNHQSNPTCAQYLDSPSTTSEITYKIQYKVQAGHAMYLNKAPNDANNSDWSHRSTSSLTVMEIAG